MPISLIANQAATFARQSLTEASDETRRSIAKISSGNRVFEAQEDAASLSIGKGLELESAVLKSAAINAQTGTSLMQIADGALGEIQQIINRMEYLASSALSEQYSSQERSFMDLEYQNMLDEIDRIVDTTEFNGVKILGGVNEVVLNTSGANIDADDGFVGFDFSPNINPADTLQVSFVASTKTLTVTNQTTGAAQTVAVDTPRAGFLNEYNFANIGVTITLNDSFDDATDMPHTGANEQITMVAGTAPSASVYEFQLGSGTTSNDRIDVNMPVVNTAQLNLNFTNLTSITSAGAAKDAIRAANDTLSSLRSTLGANLNRMEVAAQNIQISLENVELARSALLDTDVAAEITNLTTRQLIVESSTAMLAQANQQPQSLLRLLQG